MRKGQSTLEYVGLVAALVAALIGMQIYIKRALEGGWKASADNMGSQYAPKHTDSEINTRNTSYSETTNTTVERADGKLENTVISNTIFDQTEQSGHENLQAFESNLYE